MTVLDLDRMSQVELLQQKFCDLPLILTGSPVERRAERIFDELGERQLRLRPSIWLAEEWFNPDGAAGFGIPFYLVHPRLIRLERKLMLEAEGVADSECLRILRHETGHAVDEAYQLFRTPEYRATFGSPRLPYPTSYAVKPHSRDYVIHLNAWYAQSHPVEDFAETFAVWLQPRRLWRRQYRGWPALAKLEAVDRWLTARAGQMPPLAPAEAFDELARNKRTLAEHYEEKRAFYGIAQATNLDPHLKRIFPEPSSAVDIGRRHRSAVSAIRAIRTPLRKEIARPLGVPAYTVNQVLRQIIHRAKALGLKQTRPMEETTGALTRLVSRTTIDIINKGQRLPL